MLLHLNILLNFWIFASLGILLISISLIVSICVYFHIAKQQFEYHFLCVLCLHFQPIFL